MQTFLHDRQNWLAPVANVPVGRVACLGCGPRVRLIYGVIEGLFVLRSDISIFPAGGCMQRRAVGIAK